MSQGKFGPRTFNTKPFLSVPREGNPACKSWWLGQGEVGGGSSLLRGKREEKKVSSFGLGLSLLGPAQQTGSG